jgi:hypothetical protein
MGFIPLRTGVPGDRYSSPRRLTAGHNLPSSHPPAHHDNAVMNGAQLLLYSHPPAHHDKA